MHTQVIIVVENGTVQHIESSLPVEVLIIDLDVQRVPPTQRANTEFGEALLTRKYLGRRDVRASWVGRRLRALNKTGQMLRRG